MPKHDTQLIIAPLSKDEIAEMLERGDPPSMRNIENQPAAIREVRGAPPGMHIFRTSNAAGEE
jgi:hypothetical protein